MRVVVALAVALTVAVGGCGGSGSSRAGSAPGGGSSGPALVLLAASSLTGVLDGLQVDGGAVRVTYAGSPALVAQVRGGAPADVLVTASEATLRPLIAQRLVLPPTLVARNRLALVVPAANPAGIRSVRDLARKGLRVAECDPSVPCGAAAVKTLRSDGVSVRPATLVPDVKAVLRAVAGGEADAGLVYETDARSAGQAVRSLPLPSAATTAYPAAVVAASRHREAAERLIALLRGPDLRARLTAAGFQPPP